MKQVELVYCENGHVYDKSLSEECPYCRKIKQQKQALGLEIKNIASDNKHSRGSKKHMHKSFSGSTFGRDSDETEMLHPNLDADETVMPIQQGIPFPEYSTDSSEATELLHGGNSGNETEFLGNPDSEDHTVLLTGQNAADTTVLLPGQQTASQPIATFTDAGPVSATEGPVGFYEEHCTTTPKLHSGGLDDLSGNAEFGTSGLVSIRFDADPDVDSPVLPYVAQTQDSSVRPLMGWIVFVRSSSQYGRSAELMDGTNFLCLDDVGTVSVASSEEANSRCLGCILRDSTTGIFQIRPGNVEVTVNGRRLEQEMVLETCSRIEFNDQLLVFFPAVGVCGFEWRQ